MNGLKIVLSWLEEEEEEEEEERQSINEVFL